MSRVVEHLAELTGFRDRDVLDVSLVAALRDLLQPTSVAIYRNVGDVSGQQHWLTRARLGPGDTTATADPLWSELASLPLLASHADRHACLQRQERSACRRPGTGRRWSTSRWPRTAKQSACSR